MSTRTISTSSYSYVPLLLLLIASVSPQSCVKYPLSPLPPGNFSGICSGVIDYPVYLPANASIPLVEASLAQLTQLASLKASFPKCVNAYAAWGCSVSFPQCGSGQAIKFPCASLCQAAVKECTQPFTLIQRQQLIPNCAAIPRINVSYPETNCVDSTVVGAWTFNAPEVDLSTSPLFANGCPAPFVLTTKEVLAGLDPETRKKCFGPCCIPCPFVHALYPPGSMQLVTDVLTWVRVASALLAFFVLLSYITLPGYQIKPRDLILYIAGSIFFWQATVFFSIGDSRRVQCIDKFTAATQQTNTFCAAQGTIILFGVYSVNLWVVCLILNLHLHLVWKKNWVDRMMPYIRVFCVVVPAALAIVPLALGLINYEFGTVCFVTQKQSNFYFFYPLAAVVFPMLLVHLITFAAIMRSTFKAASTVDAASGNRSNNQSYGTSQVQSFSQSASGIQSATSSRKLKQKAVVTGIRMQWRPITLAFIVNLTFITFWLFQMIQLRRVLGIDPAETLWVQNWIGCLFQSLNTPSASTPFERCQSIILPEIPTFAFAVTVDTVVSTAGIWMFLIFGSRAELFIDWANFFRGGCCCGARRRKKEDKMARSLERNAEEIRTYAFIQDNKNVPTFPDAYQLSNYPPASRNASRSDVSTSRGGLYQQNSSAQGSRYDMHGQDYGNNYDDKYSDHGSRYGAWENNSTVGMMPTSPYSENKAAMYYNRR